MRKLSTDWRKNNEYCEYLKETKNETNILHSSVITNTPRRGRVLHMNTSILERAMYCR